MKLNQVFLNIKDSQKIVKYIDPDLLVDWQWWYIPVVPHGTDGVAYSTVGKPHPKAIPALDTGILGHALYVYRASSFSNQIKCLSAMDKTSKGQTPLEYARDIFMYLINHRHMKIIK